MRQVYESHRACENSGTAKGRWVNLKAPQESSVYLVAILKLSGDPSFNRLLKPLLKLHVFFSTDIQILYARKKRGGSLP